jgi:hypothetical protein
MEQDIIPKFPTISILNGSAGSGKTSVVYNLLTNPLMYGPSYELMTPEEKRKSEPKTYFDAIFLLLGSADDAYDIIIKRKIIEKNHVSIHPSPDVIQTIIDSQNKLIKEAKGNINEVPKILFIIDDLITDARFMKSKPMLEIMTRGRHINSSTILCTQYINSVPRAIRQQASYTILFKLNRVEVSLITEQYCPPGVAIKDFQKLIDFCTKDDEESKNNFMVISKKAPLSKRFRKNFITYVIPPETQDPPELNKNKKLLKAEEEEEEKFQDLLDEPLTDVRFSLNNEKINTGAVSTNPLSSQVKKNKGKKQKYYPNPNGFIHSGIYNIGGNAPRN